MIDIIQRAIDAGVPIEDNTKDEAYYAAERVRRDAEKLASHVFVKNVEHGATQVDETTMEVFSRISFDLVMFQSQTALNWNEAQEKSLIEHLTAQLLKAVTRLPG